MNGVLKRCLSEFRYRNCAFFLIDQDLKGENMRVAPEVGHVQEESVEQCLERFKGHCDQSSSLDAKSDVDSGIE